MKRGEDVRNHLDHLVSACLGVALHHSVVDEPGFQFGIRPVGPDGILDLIVILVHLSKEIVSILLIVRLDDVVRDEPSML